MLKSLVITDDWPWPSRTGGRQRTMAFVEALRGLGTVDLAARKRMEADADSDIAGVHQCYPLYGLAPDAAVNLVRGLLQTEKYDLILARYYKQAAWLFNQAGIPDVPVIVDIDDVLNFRLYTRVKDRGWYTPQHLLGYLRKRRIQRQVMNRATAVIASNPSDLPRLRSEAGGQAVCIPNVVDETGWESFNVAGGYRHRDTLLFVGTLNYAPNIAGLRWLVDKAWPTLRKQNLAGRLLVAGNNPKPIVREICAAEGVELHDSVPDIKAVYAQAGIVVVPLFEGGGSRIKILEAALAGRPVVTTALGRSGLGLTSPESLLEFQGKLELSNAVSRLHDRQTYERISSMAREHVLEHHTTKNFHQDLCSLLKAAVGNW
jgi:polysaccharide biosynthesis protein PslH